MFNNYNANIRWRFNNHWGISAISSDCSEGYVQICIISFRNWNKGNWTTYNHHGFLDNNFYMHDHFPLDLIPSLIEWLKHKLSEDYDYLELVNVEYGRRIFEEFLDYNSSKNKL